MSRTWSVIYFNYLHHLNFPFPINRQTVDTLLSILISFIHIPRRYEEMNERIELRASESLPNHSRNKVGLVIDFFPTLFMCVSFMAPFIIILLFIPLSNGKGNTNTHMWLVFSFHRSSFRIYTHFSLTPAKPQTSTRTKNRRNEEQ